jgi:hypothetical protein
MRFPPLPIFAGLDAKVMAQTLVKWGQRLVVQLERDYQDIVVGDVTLTANAASTTLNHQALSPLKRVFTEPQTANAAAEKGNGTMYVADPTKGAVVITHANNAQADRSFMYLIIGKP